jgi:hypothetical protein
MALVHNQGMGNMASSRHHWGLNGLGCLEENRAGNAMTNKVTLILAHAFWLPLFVLAVCAAQLTVWILDREPPFVAVETFPTSALPGERIILDVVVQRDLSRHCSAQYARTIQDASGVRHELEGLSAATASAIERLESDSPGRLRIAFALPVNIAPGPANLATSLVYTCNPVHAFWPIHVTAYFPFTVRG